MSTAVAFLYKHLNGEQLTTNEKMNVYASALIMEKEDMINIIESYHNNLFYVPLKDGEAERILELILTGQIKSKQL
jgi:hypothetical protein